MKLRRIIMLSFYETLFDRFHELHQEIEKSLEVLPSDALDWKPGDGMNSISVLVVHLTGAERFLMGDIVMGEPSKRDREAEFQVEGLTKEDLIHRLSTAEAYIKGAFEKLSLNDLETQRMHPRHGNQVSVAWAILHALEHTGIHVGHIQLTVQLYQLPDVEI
jgi:uncharacterized damage-inducible protein DinB